MNRAQRVADEVRESGFRRDSEVARSVRASIVLLGPKAAFVKLLRAESAWNRGLGTSLFFHTIHRKQPREGSGFTAKLEHVDRLSEVAFKHQSTARRFVFGTCRYDLLTLCELL